MGSFHGVCIKIKNITNRKARRRSKINPQNPAKIKAYQNRVVPGLNVCQLCQNSW